MILIDSLLVGGIRFVLDKVARAVDAEMNDADRIRQELLEAQLQLELGEIDEARFVELESALFARLRELKRQEEDDDDR